MNVIVIGCTFQEHLLNLQKVFPQFQEARLKINPEKCQLFQKKRRPYCVTGVDNYRPQKAESHRGNPTPKN
jgi:hypothetical protein